MPRTKTKTRNRMNRSQSFKISDYLTAHWDELKKMSQAAAARQVGDALGFVITPFTLNDIVKATNRTCALNNETQIRKVLDRLKNDIALLEELLS